LIPRVGEGPQSVSNYDQNYINKTGEQTVSDVLQKGLPPNDTLVLVDGLRYPQYPLPQVSANAVISFVDLNSIPLGAVDRIEILNDGGSATYGTDAVAGVVNLILKSDYQGAEIFNYYGISQRGDDETYHGYLVSGLNQKFSDTSKLSIVVGVDYLSQSPIMQQDRVFTQLNHTLYSPNYEPQFAFPTYTGQFTGMNSGTNYQTVPGTPRARG
jgi:iron complex outermembrane recepter protein